MTSTTPTDRELEAAVAAVSAIDAVPKLLEVICRSTGMGFAAVARVTEERWVACAVRVTTGPRRCACRARLCLSSRSLLRSHFFPAAPD